MGKSVSLGCKSNKSYFSIVMPAYNAGEFIGNALNDIVSQTFTSFEVIIVDDGSVDDTRDVVKPFCIVDERVKLVFQKNQGAGVARNTGIKYCTGKYILFLDSDDRFDNNMLETLFDEIQMYPADIIIFDAKCYDVSHKREVFSDWIVKKEKIPKKQMFNFKDVGKNVFSFHHTVPWNKVYRLKFVVENELTFQNVPFENDVLFVCKSLLCADSIHIIYKKLLTYYQNNNLSLTSNSTRQKNPDCLLKVMNSLASYIMKNYDIYEVNYSFLNYAINHFCWNLEVLKSEAYEFFFEESKKFIRTFMEKKNFVLLDIDDESLREKTSWLLEKSSGEYLFLTLQQQRKEISKLSADLFGMSQYYAEREIDYIKMLSYNKWKIDMEGVKAGNRLILYGAGMVGRFLYNNLIGNSYIEIVAWVDKDYRRIRGNVKSPQIVSNLEFDYIIFAIADRLIRINAVNDFTLENPNIDKELMIY